MVARKNAGDALYATMVFFGFGFLAPRAKTSAVALAATTFCFAIELTQRYRAPWIDAVRATTPGRLVLGQGFLAFDLVLKYRDRRPRGGYRGRCVGPRVAARRQEPLTFRRSLQEAGRAGANELGAVVPRR